MVSLPGIMTGQILGGVPLAEAVKYRILVMFPQNKNGTPQALEFGCQLINNHRCPFGCD
jgi:ABC-type iron transport system FetAB permease component